MDNFNDAFLQKLIENRPHFKKQAVITGGMPYGNKELHFGHIGGMFIHADIFARFLRDRIGKENVIFVSGTDCYGSPILEGFRKMRLNTDYLGTIEKWVSQNHEIQKQTLKDYDISLDFFGASGLNPSKNNHASLSKWIIEKLYNNNQLENLGVKQFFDKKLQVFLNGRQVIGKCPFENCQSEKAYADECDLGHQYNPCELINPVSTLSGEIPTLKETANWYFKLDNTVELLKNWIEYLEANTTTRSFIIKEIKEFLKEPEIYIKKDQSDIFDEIKHLLPAFSQKEDNKASFTIVFERLKDREKACEILSNNKIRFRTGKTLVPFRLTGDCKWGVPVPKLENLENLTFWVWPESLWAPISFTKTYLDLKKSKDTWEKWWCNADCQIYQFIGEDNIYFYGPAQHSMWLNLYSDKPTFPQKDGKLQISQLVANKHILFLDKKASSSGNIKPPMAQELLKHYTNEQLRFHFISLGLGNNSASFMPKIYNPDAKPDEVDPVLKEGNLLTNVFNRALRTLFYTWQKDFDGIMPYGIVENDTIKQCKITMLKYEKLMSEQKFHMVSYELDTLIRNLNKYLAKELSNTLKKTQKNQIIVNALHIVKTALLLLHPIVPSGSEYVAKCLNLNDDVFCWKNIDCAIYDFITNPKQNKPKFLEPKEDFFVKHKSQLEF